MRASGKKVKRPTRTAIETTAPATKASPRKKPRSASPVEHRKRKAARTTTASAASSTTPGRTSQGRSNLAACSTAGARSRFASIPAGQPEPRKPSASAYHGSRRKPTLPRVLQINALRRRPRPMVAPLLRLAVDLFLPPVDQPLALRFRAVLREVVVDQLDLGELRRLRGQLGLRVRGHLELLVVGAELLRRGRERPVEELLRVVQVACALDDAQRPDLVAGALARGLGLDRESGDGLGDAVVHEADADRGLTPRHRLDGAGARAGVLVHVLVQ